MTRSEWQEFLEVNLSKMPCPRLDQLLKEAKKERKRRDVLSSDRGVEGSERVRSDVQ